MNRLATILEDFCGCTGLPFDSKTGSTSVLWSSITNQLNTDICAYDQSVLPSTIGISDDNSSEFVIVFADYCNCSDSINGENIYTETLIDILQYLEDYLSKL